MKINGASLYQDVLFLHFLYYNDDFDKKYYYTLSYLYECVVASYKIIDYGEKLMNILKWNIIIVK